MAEKGTGGGDWTAGIVAIFAALLLGSAIPIGLYFGLYKPKVAEHAEANKKLNTLKVDMQLMVERSDRVRKLEEEEKEMEGHVAKVETPFTTVDVGTMNPVAAVNFLDTAANNHYLDPLPERRSQMNVRRVYKAGNRIQFENGLWATKIRIEAQAYYHDFARFVNEMEHAPGFVFVPEMLICRGDSNGGSAHAFVMDVYVIERRDIDRIGR